MANREWNTPEWFKDTERRHLWLYQTVTEDSATLSALVTVVERLSEELDECKRREGVASARAIDTDTKIDKLITVLTPITNAHDQRISSVVANSPQNPLQWMIAYPGRTAIGIITATVLGGLLWKAFVWLVHLAAEYGK